MEEKCEEHILETLEIQIYLRISKVLCSDLSPQRIRTDRQPDVLFMIDMERSLFASIKYPHF